MNGFLFTVFALEMREREAYRKRVCTSLQGLRFRAWPIYAGFTVLFLIGQCNVHWRFCKYVSLSHEPDYQRIQ